MSVVNQSWVLGQRALREAWRTPDSTIPTLLIPLFFLLVNVGQAGRIFPSEDTDFLYGQTYAGFQLASSMLLAASFGSAALYLVEDIEGGYFDKLRATPISRAAIVLGRLTAELAKGVGITLVLILLSLPFGVRIQAGVVGWLLIVLLNTGWAVVYSGFMQVVALRTRSAAATQSASLVFFPLLFLTPSFAPRELLTRPMEIAAGLNPVTYVMEALRVLTLQENPEWDRVGIGFAVVAVLGAVMLVMNVRTIRSYD